MCVCACRRSYGRVRAGAGEIGGVAGLWSVSPKQRRGIAELVGGKRNKEIAQALYVTPKTVEVHLSNAYRKLDIRSRQELTRALSS